MDPTGQIAESVWDAASLSVGLVSLGNNIAAGNWSAAGMDTIGVIADAAALAIPMVPGGASIAIKAGDVAKGAGKADDFFEGTKYTNKVKGQMKQGDFHSFPESVKGFQDAGKVSKLKGGDGVVREKLEIPGSYRGLDGQFEFIKEPNNTINHRLFRPKNKE